MGTAALVCRGRLDPIMVVCAILAVGCGLWAVGCGLWAVGCGLIVITRACLRLNLASPN